MAGFKNLKRSRRDEYESDGNSEVETKPAKSSKKSKTATANAESGKDADGNSFWSLSESGKRRVTISEFRKSKFVNIREYYADAEGELKPGKKGISLPLEQYNALLKAIPAINAALSSEGFDVVDVGPNAPASASSQAIEKTRPKEKQKIKKANIEATSDEEEKEEDEASN
ncbi:transcriptional Coactivator p15-domain-containing protein [Xylariales sp. AK1849]|nr:transcriptional Coactivator p15-domain-containing protein [Xylariales sp. AK1849]